MLEDTVKWLCYCIVQAVDEGYGGKLLAVSPFRERAMFKGEYIGFGSVRQCTPS